MADIIIINFPTELNGRWRTFVSYDGFCVHGDGSVTDLKGRSIDDLKAIPLVRCIDCSHCYFADNRVPDEQGWVCDIHPNEPVNLNGFCERGKRREAK